MNNRELDLSKVYRESNDRARAHIIFGLALFLAAGLSPRPDISWATQVTGIGVITTSLLHSLRFLHLRYKEVRDSFPQEPADYEDCLD